MCSFLRFLFLEFQGLICSCFRMPTVLDLYEAESTGGKISTARPRDTRILVLEKNFAAQNRTS